MQDTGKRGDSSGGRPASLREALLAGCLSQLRCLYASRAFIRKGFFSGALFFFFGLSGVLPVPSLADADTDRYEELSSVDQKEDIERTSKERCLLEEDVRLFRTLQEKQSGALQTVIPCGTSLAYGRERMRDEQSTDTSESLGKTMSVMVAGYPLEAMVPAIAQYDRVIAGLIVGIAKKESNWGKRVPVLDDQDCFNYWGYKGAGSRGMAMGHGCFGSPEEAVTAIGERLKTLVALRQGSEPKHMIVWKCGSSCSGHSDASVKKWIADVSLYYDRIVAR